MVETALGHRNIPTGCSTLAVPSTALTRVRRRGIGALNIPPRIGAFSGVVSLVSALKADNTGATVEVVEVPSGTVVVSAAGVEVVGTVGVSGAWCLRWTISRLRCRLKVAGLLTARTFLNIHPPLATFKHGLALGLQLNGLVHHGLHVFEVMDNQGTLQFIMEPIHEALHLLVLSVRIFGSIPGQVSELIQIPNHILASLPQLAELILFPFNESIRYVLLTELVLEVLLVNDVTNWLKSPGSLSPRSCRSSEVVSGIQYHLSFSYGSNIQIIRDSVKPVICLQWVDSLGVSRWVGLLKITQG